MRLFSWFFLSPKLREAPARYHVLRRLLATALHGQNEAVLSLRPDPSRRAHPVARPIEKARAN